jgi:hypothetical protein
MLGRSTEADTAGADKSRSRALKAEFRSCAQPGGVAGSARNLHRAESFTESAIVTNGSLVSFQERGKGGCAGGTDDDMKLPRYGRDAGGIGLHLLADLMDTGITRRCS